MTTTPAPAPSLLTEDVARLHGAVGVLQAAIVEAESVARQVMATHYGDDPDVMAVWAFLDESMTWVPSGIDDDNLYDSLRTLLLMGSQPEDIGLPECPY